MPVSARKIVSPTLRQQIVQAIRQAILTRSLVPGERLVERELAKRLGTSIAAAREALIQLEMDGLITKTPNAATHVTVLSRQEVIDIFVVRELLERNAFLEVATAASHQALLEIRSLHRAALSAAHNGDVFKYIDADMKWHHAVWRATGNQCLSSTLSRLTLPLFGFSTIEAASHREFDLVLDAHSHEPLLIALCDQDPAQMSVAFDNSFALWRSNSLKGHELKQYSLSA